MKQIWNIAKLDLLLWRRMPMAIVAALIPPLGMTLLLIVLSFSITQQPVALVVQSQSPNTLAMKKIILSDDDAYILHQVDENKAHQLLDDQEVAAIITIPKNFDQKVAQGIAPVDLTLNNIDIDFADDIRH